jgi:hypothetical protein
MVVCISDDCLDAGLADISDLLKQALITARNGAD